MSVESNLREFIDAGYRPTIKSHALKFTEDFVEEGYAVLSGIPAYDEDDPPRQQCIGWMVDAKDAVGLGRQYIIGATKPTVEAAIEYALGELAKYRGNR